MIDDGSNMDIQNPAFINQSLTVHRIISIEIARHWEQILDRFWVQEQAVEQALRVIENLDQILNTNEVLWSKYRDNRMMLASLIEELRLGAVLKQRFSECFGHNDFLEEYMKIAQD